MVTMTRREAVLTAAILDWAVINYRAFPVEHEPNVSAWFAASKSDILRQHAAERGIPVIDIPLAKL
jgi:hypothetical protein